jgi:D-3-phosphoglycerate dehydrogenase
VEAQENVAVQIAAQISDYLLTGAIANALNMPSMTADEAKRAGPWIALAEKLGLFAGQLTETSIQAIDVQYEGNVQALNTGALTHAVLAGLLRPILSQVNMINAPVIARERGIKVSQRLRDQQGAYEGYILLSVTTEQMTRSVAGTVFSDGRPRLIQVKGIDVNGEFSPHMLYVTNEDKPGMIGRLGTLLGNAGINIASFALGRASPGADAIALVEVDTPVGPDVLAQIVQLPLVKQARALSF